MHYSGYTDTLKCEKKYYFIACNPECNYAAIALQVMFNQLILKGWCSQHIILLPSYLEIHLFYISLLHEKRQTS